MAANIYSFTVDTSHTFVLSAIHLPLALWLVVGVAYVASEWRSSRVWASSADLSERASA